MGAVGPVSGMPVVSDFEEECGSPSGGSGSDGGSSPSGYSTAKHARGGTIASATTATDASDTEVGEVDDEVASEGSDMDLCHRFRPEETAMIFDWDDTVLPSSWVHENGLRLEGELPITLQQQEELACLAHAAAETLRIAKRLGTVVLVTNAERGWIELSCQRFLPSLAPLLENIKLLSARSEYERPGILSPLEWKILAFSDEVSRIFAPDEDGSRRKNVLSFGDSAHEREAMLRVTASIPNCRAKSMKFVDRPCIETLCRQHMLVARCFRRIVHHDGNLDLCISEF